jgi:hypothetical protein
MLPMNARKWIVALLPALALAPMAAREAEVDTQFIFGLTMGADVGELGEREIESQTVGRFGKSGGSYAAIETQLRAEITPTENIRIEMGFPIAYHGITGVTGLDDCQQGAFEGVSFEARYRLLDRDHAPFGLTIGAEPHWTRVDRLPTTAVNSRSRLPVFVGPTMYATLSKTMAISATWSVQVAGHAVDVPGSLDLKNFERHRAQLRLMYNF